MKLYIKHAIWGLVGAFILAIVGISLNYFSSHYMQTKDVSCIIIDKLSTEGGHRSSGHLYLIVKDDNQRIFDIEVRPATYVTSNKNDIRVFKLREYDIEPKNIYLISAALGMTFLTFACISIIYSILTLTCKDECKDEEE